jgi:hypothetical protein
MAYIHKNNPVINEKFNSIDNKTPTYRQHYTSSIVVDNNLLRLEDFVLGFRSFTMTVNRKLKRFLT